MKIKICDNLFAHAKYSTDYQISENITWDRSPFTNNDDLVIFTDNTLNQVNPNIKTKIAWLLESNEITKSSYDWMKYNNNKFDHVLTYYKEFLDRGENFLFNPIGGCWINSEDQQIYEKVKNISIISSNKKMTYGHHLRHQIINQYRNNIDVFGRGYNSIDYKLTGLKDYRFSITIENTKTDYYFTEKLIDCFMTGTVPIYWGCPSIDKFFNIKGMIIIDSIDNIDINNLNEETYNSMLPYINENFEKAKEFIMCEDYIWKKYFIE